MSILVTDTSQPMAPALSSKGAFRDRRTEFGDTTSPKTDLIPAFVADKLAMPSR